MKKHRKAVTFFRQKSYLLAALLMVAAVLGMTGVYVSEQRAKQREEKAKQEQLAVQEQIRQEQQDAAAVDQVIPPQNDDFLDAPDVISTTNPETPDSAAEVADQAPEQAQEQVSDPAAETTSPKKLHFNAADGMEWPLAGNVLMNYSMDQTTYFATLDQYKYNPALVIQGKVNDKVFSVADGKVSHIEINEETGSTVTVSLGDGYSAVYGQLKEVEPKVGDYIEAKEVIGFVNEPTKYYSVEGPNLYFQLLKDNESIDPMEYLQ